MTHDTDALAVFVDRRTMRYDRRYAHPIERVWDAVSTGEQLDVWMLPTCRVERRAGGRCSFTFGAAEEAFMQVGEVTDFDPPRLVTYSFAEPESFMRFELEPDGDGTRLHFTLWWPVRPGQQNEPEDYPGGDLPAGPDTPWRPGFLAGFHEMLGDLDAFLHGTFTATDRAAHLESFPHPEYEGLVAVYREHVREHCPAR
jgi:uncharacterized protein YndB with AHSA1/START domain